MTSLFSQKRYHQASSAKVQLKELSLSIFLWYEV